MFVEQSGNQPSQEPNGPEIGDVKEIDGIKYIFKETSYTVRQFYSHETEYMGPGPGWDLRQSALDKYGVRDVSDLPNDPYCKWEPI